MHFLRTALFVFALPCAAHADSAEMLHCREIKDSPQRLVCYDAIDLNTSPEAAPPKTQDQFGLSPTAREAEADSVETALITDVDGWRPNDVFQLANGQRWQVADGSSSVMHPKKPQVKVRRGAFGAYYIDFAGINQSPRVKRIQ